MELWEATLFVILGYAIARVIVCLSRWSIPCRGSGACNSAWISGIAYLTLIVPRHSAEPQQHGTFSTFFAKW